MIEMHLLFGSISKRVKTKSIYIQLDKKPLLIIPGSRCVAAKITSVLKAAINALTFTSLVLLGLLVKNVHANTYYIDATLGVDYEINAETTCIDDGNNGCSYGPLKTFSSLYNTVINDGDRVLLKCNEEWNTPIDIDQIMLGRNIGESPIRFSSYGSNCSQKPRLLLAENISEADIDWYKDQDGSGERYYTDDIDFEILQLFVDGIYIRPAQHPNFSYFSIDHDSVNQQSLYDTNELIIPDGEDISDAEIYIRSRDWAIENRSVVSYNELSGQIKWNEPTVFDLHKDYGYYLTNKLWMLDARAEWFQDSITKRVYIRMPGGDNPVDHSIMASRYDYGIVSTGAKIKNFEFSDIEIQMPGKIGIYILNGVKTRISNVDIINSGGKGIFFRNGGTSGAEESAIIENNKIINTVNEGIYLNNLENTVIHGNEVINTGIIGSPKKIAAAITLGTSSYSTITGNVIRNTGYIGIRFGKKSTVKNNFVENTCLVFDDCGGIYTWNRFKIDGVYATKEQYSIDDNYDSIISYNIVTNVIGNSDGTPENSKKINLSKGIYLDQGSNKVTVDMNTVINAEHGIWVNSGWNNTIKRNKLIANRRSQIGLNEGSKIIDGGVVDNIATSNILVPLSRSEPIFLQSVYSDLDLGEFYNNKYIDIHSNSIAYQRHKPNSTWDYRELENGEWPDVSGEFFTGFGMAPYLSTSDLGVSLISQNTFTGTTSAIKSKWFGSYIYKDDCLDLDGACIQITSGADGIKNANSDPFSLIKNDRYFLVFDAVADENFQNIRLISKITATSSPVGLDEVVTVSRQRRHYQQAFTSTISTADDESAKIQFDVPIGDSVRIDNVYLYKISTNLITNSNFENDINKWNGSPEKVIHTNPCGIEGGCLAVSGDLFKQTSANSNTFSVVQDKKYRLEFDAVGVSMDQNYNVKIKSKDTEITLGLIEEITATTEVKHHKFEFTATQSTSTASLFFEVKDNNRVLFDNVYLSAVRLSENNYTNDACILINNQTTVTGSREFLCEESCGDISKCDSYVTLTGNPVNWPVNVDDYDSEILIWSNSPFRDSDRDIHIDLVDNCPIIFNASQSDMDNDSFGDACDSDVDGDGLTNDDEIIWKTKFNNPDTDKDGITDYEEINSGSDPLVPSSIFSSSINNYINPNTENHLIAANEEGRVMQVEDGYFLLLGEVALANGLSHAQITSEMLDSGVSAGAVTDGFSYHLGIFDFEVSGIVPGDSIKLVIPMNDAIQENSVYRKYFTGIGWLDFDISTGDIVKSSAGDLGLCPPPGDDSYSIGLTAGHYCIELTITDGGPNDTDGIANGVISDPGSVAVKSNDSSSSGGDSGGGALNPLYLLFLFACFAINRNYRCQKPKYLASHNHR